MVKKPKKTAKAATKKVAIKPLKLPRGALVIAKQGHFFVGGQYHTAADGSRYMAGQAYVEFQIPVDRRQRYPLVMIHGGGQTGENFTGTPDGRDGWAQYFLRQGYAVYIMDQPGRGKAVYDVTYGPQRRSNAERVQNVFTAGARTNRLPMTKHHNQWPGSGLIGDPAFDAFYASQVSSIEDPILSQTLNRDAGAALLDKIGPAILMTHSQSGHYGWAIADARPGKVKAVIGIEPGGVFADIEGKGPPDWYSYQTGNRPWGLGLLPLAYDPPVTDASELRFVQEEKPQHPDLARIYLQAEPARKLKNLVGLPVLVVTGEASFHKPYDHGTVQFLNQAGADATHIPLEQVGLHGNGHMMMLEKNNQKIAAVIHRWIAKKLPPKARR